MLNLRRILLAGTLILTFGAETWIGSAATPTMTIGHNFTGSTYGVNSSAIPADCNGVVGPRHFVEFINGTFAVYNKTNGASVKRIADTKFWSNAGIVLANSDGITDPRVIYDPLSQRWFASMVDLDASTAGAGGDPTLESNDFLLAVSLTSDPTGSWKGFLFQADPDNGNFADFPTLGVDANGVYLSGDFYHGESNPVGAGLFSFPKADLVAATPTIANATWFGVMDYAARGQVLQPANCFDNTPGRILAASDIGNDSNPHSNIVSSVVQNVGTSNATLSSSSFIPTLPWVVPDNIDLGVPQFAAAQPDGTQNLIADDARLLARAFAIAGVVYAVQTTDFNNHLAIRWYRIRASDGVLLESGTISDPSLDLFYPSIAANQYGVVVIGFNLSGSSSLISSYAIAGQTLNGVTTFGNRVLLQAGANVYHGDDEILAQLLGDPVVSRWGDYSATSLDPNDPNRFWTTQMYPSPSTDGDVWSTQITELITTPQVFLTIQPTGTNVLVSWPNVPGYHLQSTTNFTPSSVWSNVVQTPGTNNGFLTVTWPVPASSRQFFRLKLP
jgi:hypothetical protein